MRDCRNITAASTPPTVPPGLVATISVTKAASSSAVAISDIDERLCSQGHLVMGVIRADEESSLSVSNSGWKTSTQRMDSAGSLRQCYRLSKVAFHNFPASYSSSSSMRPIFSQQWSTQCCSIVLRVGPVITLNKKRAFSDQLITKKPNLSLRYHLAFRNIFKGISTQLCISLKRKSYLK